MLAKRLRTAPHRSRVAVSAPNHVVYRDASADDVLSSESRYASAPLAQRGAAAVSAACCEDEQPENCARCLIRARLGRATASLPPVRVATCGSA